MTKPTISIGLPVYNGADYLQEAIASVLGQTFPDWELVIRDNASSDQTEAICRAFARCDQRIQYLRNATNVGAGPNFNSLVGIARGEYFKWLAHDDVMAPSFLERCIAALRADSTAVLACPRVRFIDSRSECIEAYVTPFRTGNPDPAVRFEEMLKGHPCFEIFGLIRLDRLKRTRLVGRYRHGDGVLLAHLALLGSFAEVPEFLFYSRRHEKQSMHVYRVSGANGAPDTEGYAQWFDPTNLPALSRSYNRMLAEYFRMNWDAPLSARQRIACCRSLTRWCLSHWKKLGGEWKRTMFHACGVSLGAPRRARSDVRVGG